jgi:hypothetical protein
VATFPENAFLIDKKKQICALPAWSSGIVSACGVWVVRSNPAGVCMEAFKKPDLLNTQQAALTMPNTKQSMYMNL